LAIRPPPNIGCHSKNFAKLELGLVTPLEKHGLR